MVVLDTNHYSEIERETVIGLQLEKRIRDGDADAFITVATFEEVTRGWLARLNSFKGNGVDEYARFQRSVTMAASWTILPWEDDAALNFEVLRRLKARIGTLDLRIASIAIAYDATLLTRNVAHFQPVPGLKIENWLD